MRIKTIQKESGTYVRLPEEFRKAEELELFALRDGYYLLSVPLGAGTAKAAEKPGAKYAPAPKAATPEAPGGLSQQESRVLMKLADIRFEKRVPQLINKDFSRQDREALMSLEKKGAVTLIKSKKYPGGVYSIQNDFYPQPQKKEGEAPKPADTDLEKQLFRDGYIVVSDSNAAQRLSDVLQKQRGAITGVKGFDGKYYMVTKAFAGKVKAALVKMGGDYADPKDVGAQAGLHPDGVKAVLKILAESGEYMEKGEIFIKVE
ncbi:MAG: hypothetical protein WC350_02920 [Candidatus Micrarchaeia archaeon]